MSVYDEYDDCIEVLHWEVHVLNHFNHQFHESIESIVHEESDLVYDNYGSKLEPGFEKHIFISTCIGSHSIEPICDCYIEEFEKSVEFFYEEHISIQDLKGNGGNLQPFSVSFSDIEKGYIDIIKGEVKGENT
jgi:hypothetical protein